MNRNYDNYRDQRNSNDDYSYNRIRRNNPPQYRNREDFGNNWHVRDKRDGDFTSEGSQGYGRYQGQNNEKDFGYRNRNDYGNDYGYYTSRNDGGRYSSAGDDNFFSRGAERIRDNWRDWRERENYRPGYSGNDQPNFFERAGERIRDRWNQWTHPEDTRYQNQDIYSRNDRNDRNFYEDERRRSLRSRWNDGPSSYSDYGYRSETGRENNGNDYYGRERYDNYGNDESGQYRSYRESRPSYGSERYGDGGGYSGSNMENQNRQRNQQENYSW